jgi:hypothetical protein
MRVLPLLILGTLILFLAALIAPRKSRRLQRWIKRRMQKGERKGHRNAGFVGDWTAKMLDLGQRWIDRVMAGGRKTRAKLPGEGGKSS